MSDNLIVEKIYLSWMEEQDKVDTRSIATDVVVTMKNKNQYLATFYTYAYLRDVMEKEQAKGRLYWCMTPFTLVESLELTKVRKVVDKMIDCGDFQLMFLKLN